MPVSLVVLEIFYLAAVVTLALARVIPTEGVYLLMGLYSGGKLVQAGQARASFARAGGDTTPTPPGTGGSVLLPMLAGAAAVTRELAHRFAASGAMLMLTMLVAIGVTSCSGSQVEASGYGIDVKAAQSRPWVPNPAPTTIINVYGCDADAGAVLEALDGGGRDAEGER